MKIEAVHKENGKITKYKLDNGRVVNKERCITMVSKGKIENCHVGCSRLGENFVAADRGKEGSKSMSLNALPTF